MKSKRKMMYYLLAALMVVNLFCVTLFASAAPYNVGLEGEAPIPAGVSDSKITDSLNAKIAEMNAAIQAVLDTVNVDGMTDQQKSNAYEQALSQAYARGEILGYSIHKTGGRLSSNGLITNDNNRSGYKTWEGLMLADLKFMNDGYGGWGDQYIGCITYDGVNDKSYVVLGKFAAKLYTSQKVGSAIGDKFRVTNPDNPNEYIEYQNFTGGYMKSVNGGDAQIIYRKNYVYNEAAESYEEVPARGNATGYVGAVAKNNPLIQGGTTRETIYDKFVQVYEYFQNEKSFNIGSPFSIVRMTSKANFYYQEFLYGDSVATPWGDDRQSWSYLALNTETMNVYLIRDEFMYIYERNTPSNLKNLGMPVSNDFEVTSGDSTFRVQNFTNGYIKVTGARSNNNVSSRVTLVEGKNMLENGSEISLDPSENVGVLSASVNVPQGITAEQLTALFVSCYNSVKDEFIEMLPTGLVTQSGEIISQLFNARDARGTATVMLAYDHDNQTVRYMSSASYDAFKLNTALGYPTTDIMLVAEGSETLPAIKVQGFKNGYIRIQSTMQIDENWNVYYVDRGVGTIGATYNPEFNYFENINYVDEVGILSTVPSGDSSRPSNADADHNVPQGEALTNLFKQAYQYYWDLGFSVGRPTAQGVVWWVTGVTGIVKQGFQGGNGTADLWGDNAMLVYDADNGVVRLVTGPIGTEYGRNGASGNGYPVSEMMINPATGVVIQNFRSKDRVIQERRVYFVMQPDGTVTKLDGNFDFTEGEGLNFVPYLTLYKINTITLKTFTPQPSYEAGEQITIDLRQYIENPQKYVVTFDRNVSVGTLSEDGVWTFTPEEDGAIDLEVDIYTAFEKVTFAIQLNVGAVVDKSELQALYDSVKDMQQGNYTGASFYELVQARNAAKEVLDDEDATQEEVDQALARLQDAIDNLTEVTAPQVDKSALQQKYDEYSQIEKGNYTDETWEFFQDALENAREILEKENATQAEVDAALQYLNQTRASLIEDDGSPVPIEEGCGCQSSNLYAGMVLASFGLVLAAAFLAKRKQTEKR